MQNKKQKKERKWICKSSVTPESEKAIREISDELGISRQGVSDAVHRSLKALDSMEQKLHMCERFLNISGYIEQMQRGLQP
jgi:predicted DNA-binding protein YlxM (UPF0122 family)